MVDAAAIVEHPAVRDRQPGRMAHAQVVGVRVTLGEQFVEPDVRPAVVVRERHRGAFGAPRT